jgi:hypothetical protein
MKNRGLHCTCPLENILNFTADGFFLAGFGSAQPAKKKPGSCLARRNPGFQNNKVNESRWLSGAEASIEAYGFAALAG